MKNNLKITLITLTSLAAVAVAGVGAYRYAEHRYHVKQQEKMRFYGRLGDFYDTHGNLIVSTERLYGRYLDCLVIEDDEEWKQKTLALAPGLASLFPERSAAEWWEYLQEGRRLGKRYLPIARGLSKQQEDSLEALPLFKESPSVGGGIIESYLQRTYPYDSLARRTLGYLKDCIAVGIEGKYNKMLPGWKYDHARDLRLTLDMPLQQVADSALRAAMGDDTHLQAGCVVVMDVKSGAIRAMVNLSRGVPSHEHPRLWERYNDAIAHLYEPGEVLQTMALASALRDGNLHSLDETIPTHHGALKHYQDDPRIREYEAENNASDISVLKGFGLSSPYVMAYLTTRHYEASRQYYVESIRNYSLPEGMDFDIEGLRPVDITRPDGHYWTQSTLASLANGFCLVMAPLDILSFYNTIANKGTMVKPFLVEAIGDSLVSPAILRKDVISPLVADTLTRALRRVVLDGTAGRLKEARYPVAGKTGTASQIIKPYDEKGLAYDPYHDKDGRHSTAATFAGFFPADDPQYSIICVIYSNPCEKTYFGGGLPAQVVLDVVNSTDI